MEDVMKKVQEQQNANRAKYKKLMDEMIKKIRSEKPDYNERRNKFGIEIVIKDLHAPHIKGRSDRKEISFTMTNGRHSGDWTTYDMYRVLETLDKFYHMLDWIFSIDETESDGKKRVEEERLQSSTELLDNYHDRQQGKEWMEFKKENR
jgi:hypothetical protein